MGILQQVVSRTLLVAGRTLANCSLVVLWIAFSSAGTEARAESPNPVAMPDYTVVMTWTEQSPVSPDVQVGGCLYRDPVTGRHVERYFDAGGAPLDRAALKGLGILAKQWNPVKRSQPTEFVPSEKRVEKIQLKPLLSFEETPQLVFPPKDIAALLEEDSLDSGEIKGLLRIGIAEDMIPAIEVRPNEATAGAWQVKEDGVRVWALTLRSLDAVGQRVRISGLRPQPGFELIVYPSDSLGEARAITKEGWSPTCFGEALTLECRIAPQVTDFLPFTLDGLVYLYRDPLTASAEKAEACNIPVVCEVGWATAAMSVGGLGTVSRGAALFCTGTLIADMVPETTIPYFLTANHCVGDVEGAENLEVYWLYQASTCDGTADSLEDVTRTTGGADILTTSNYLTGTDVSLVQLRGSVPEGIPYAGWTTDTVAPERGVVAIHHPSGAPKCISFGVVPDRVDGERLVPESRFHAVVWNRGTTEHGSSGCPLFVEDSGLIIGQLYGGYASCDSPAEPDYFGRFDKSYALLRPYLDPGDDHGDDAGSSTTIQADGTPVSGAIEESGDVDWFNFPAGVGTCTLQTEGEADTVLTLYSTDGVTVLACNDDSDGPQSLITWEMSAVGTYYASVQLRNGSNTGTYSLAVTAQDVVPKTGSLTVTILPEDAVTAGAKWKQGDCTKSHRAMRISVR